MRKRVRSMIRGAASFFLCASMLSSFAVCISASGSEAANDETSNVNNTAKIYEDSLYNKNKIMPDTWVFTDGLGRTSLTNEDVGNPKEDKNVAMFYWSWHDELGKRNAMNTTEFLKKYPDAKHNYYHPAWPDSDETYCFWNEPIYGYYRTSDAWVLRKQVELFANAGVDVIFTDNTNWSKSPELSFTWKSAYTSIYEQWSAAMQYGVKTPKVSYLMPFSADNPGSDVMITSIYNDIYKEGKYKDLWFYLDGKPMLAGYASDTLSPEISDFFTFRGGQASYLGRDSVGLWGWLSVYPQPVYYGNRQDRKNKIVEQIPVGVAMNHNYVNNEITAMNGEYVMGRSYTSNYKDRYYKEGERASLYGYNFSQQFEYALTKNPKLIFITGWNEWHAERVVSWGVNKSIVENALPDQFDNEFSRDIEPTKGELKDHYYYLMANFIRRYKGCNPIPEPSYKKTIDINGDMSQWNDVEPYYASYLGNTMNREAQGYGSLVYKETSGRNDIIGSQIARDSEFIYFNVECAENITPYTDRLWMTLYIDTDKNNNGWETFDYAVNKSAASKDKSVLERFTGEGYESEKVCEVEYKVNGRYMVIKIPKLSLGLEGDEYTINFSWTDNVHDEGDYDNYSGDIMDFYISGDVAPGGRFKYSYVSKEDSCEQTDTGKVTDDTDADTAESRENVTDDTVLEEETDKNASGCKSVVNTSSWFIFSVSMIVSCLIYLKKRKYNRKGYLNES